MTRPPLLHRDDPGRDPLGGHVKVTREDWLAHARDMLVRRGVADVKIAPLARAMQVSRSSFYWYFKGRRDLLDALLHDWEMRNTTQIVLHCQMEARTISSALCNFFTCFIDPSRFDRGLDFAVREWARSDGALRACVDKADCLRIDAVRAMFQAHGYGAQDADARARIVYFMQLGYHALDVREPMATRLARIGPYLEGFTGQRADAQAVREFTCFVQGLGQGEL